MTRGAMRYAVLVVALSAGCLSQVAPEHGASVPDDTAVRQMLATSDFETLDFVRINKEPYPTAIKDGNPVDVNIYANVDHADEYRAIAPEHKDQGMHVSPGLVVVRVAQDPVTQQPLELTVMVRHDTGYFPDCGDFLFGVTDLSGTPVNDPHSGSPEWGQLQSCASCHAQRAGDAYLFGVTLAAR